MSLVDYGFYSDEEGDAASSPTTSLPSNRNASRPAPESSPPNADNSLSDSEVTYNSRASTPAPTFASSRPVDTAKGCTSPGTRATEGRDPQAAASPVPPPDDASQVYGYTEGAESEEQRRALDEERAVAQELMSRVPKGAPPEELLATIERLQHLKRRGITVNGNINTSLDFKNPYLLEKIMKVFDIDPYCSNYPPGLSDASGAPPFEVEGEDAPFYVYIAKRQERRRQRRAKQREVKEALAAAAASLGPTSASTPSKSQQQNSSSVPPSAGVTLNSSVHVNVAVTQAAREAVRKAEARALLLQQQQLLLHQ